MMAYTDPATKSPWNPSRKATARVSNPLPAPTECPFCGGPVEIAHHDDIYGRPFGDWPWAYLCKPCDAYVGMHPFTNIPLGTLANKELRTARKNCKPAFERLHQHGRWDRSEAYRALADRMGIPVEECHFGWFDRQQCEAAKRASLELYREEYGHAG